MNTLPTELKASIVHQLYRERTESEVEDSEGPETDDEGLEAVEALSGVNRQFNQLCEAELWRVGFVLSC